MNKGLTILIITIIIQVIIITIIIQVIIIFK